MTKREDVFQLGNIVKVVSADNCIDYMAVENHYKHVKDENLFLQGLFIDFDNQHWAIGHFDENFVYGDEVWYSKIIGYAKASDEMNKVIQDIYENMSTNWDKVYDLYDEVKKYVEENLIEIA